MAVSTKYDDQLESKLKAAELLQEQIGLLQRVREIELQIGGVSNEQTPFRATPSPAQRQATPTPTAVGEVRRRGRPKGSTNAAKADRVAKDDGKSVDLPTLLETIAQQVNKPMVLADFVTKAREAGYTTKAKDFSNMVYQSVLKLVKKGTFKKDDETRSYQYVGTKVA